jgi:hypothetical protein
MNTKTSRLNCLRLLLEPVVRVCLRYGFSIQDVTEAAKMAFVKVADREIVARGEKSNVSRLSIMSGLHRRDVMRLIGDNTDASSDLSVVSRVIGQWCHDKRFTLQPGKPRVLSYSVNNDEFGKLVTSISQDLHPGTVLFELQRRELVAKDGDRVTLLVHSLDTRSDEAEGLVMLAEDASDLTAAVITNLGATEALSLHSKTEYDAIPAERADEARVWLFKKGAAWQAEARTYLSSLDLDTQGTSAHSQKLVRVALGMFGLIAAVPERSSLSSEQAATVSKEKSNVR